MKTDNTVQHTQGKWEVCKGSYDTMNIETKGMGNDGFAIAKLKGIDRKANADHIVKCVNTHNDLVNTLQECIREFKCYDMQKETLLLIDKINKLVSPL